MYNLADLNDYEFEILCKDIMERRLNTKLRVYKPGRDGGIDINAFTGNSILIQAKHYINSTYSSLRNTLTKELDKVKTLKPQQYYICSGLALTAGNVTEIYTMFQDFMKDSSNIIDATQINEFLQQDDNVDIVRKNFKLWLAASNVFELILNQNVFIDCEELISDIQSYRKLYVETSAYFASINMLSKNNVVIILGAPGVGKSVLSKMLLLHCIGNDYSVRYTTDNSISDIKKTLSRSVEKKEIVLLDDFLGQHYLKIKDNQSSELKTLISFINRSKNKKLIMNSRITILNEAKRASINFMHLMEDIEPCNYVINMDDLSYIEKAKILYNHIYFNQLPIEYFRNIRKDQGYINIVKHRNYNPRIIEHVSKPRNYKSVLPSEYYGYIISKLDNPQDVWEDEFVNRIEDIDRKLLHTIYSLTDKYIDGAILEECFNYRLQRECTFDTTINQFDVTTQRLSESLIRIVIDKKIRKIGVLNPSINDYIHVNIIKNNIGLRSIINSAVYIEQMLKFHDRDSTREIITRKIMDGSLLTHKSLEFSSYYYYLFFVLEYHIINKSIQGNVNISILNAKINLNNEQMRKDYSNLVIKIISSDIAVFYEVLNIIFNPKNIYTFIAYMDIEQIDKFKRLMTVFFQNSKNEELLNVSVEVLKPYIIEKVEQDITTDFQTELDNLLDSFVHEIDGDYITQYMQDEDDKLIQIIKEKIGDYLFDNLPEFLESYPNILDLSTDDINIDNVLDTIDYHELITNYFVSMQDDDYDDYHDHRNDSGSNEFDEIKHMFERG